MFAVNQYFKEEIHFIKKYQTRLVYSFTIIITLMLFCMVLLRTIKPSNRNIANLCNAFFRTSLTEKLQFTKVSIMLNLYGNKVFHNGKLIGHLYLEYYDAMGDVILVANYKNNPKNIIFCYIEHAYSTTDIERFIVILKLDCLRRRRDYGF